MPENDHRPGNRPGVGDTVRDAASGRVGVYMAAVEGRAYLRPLGGGREWDTRRENVRVLTPEEELSAKVRAANARSEQGL